jgi:hypothetical protein
MSRGNPQHGKYGWHWLADEGIARHYFAMHFNKPIPRASPPRQSTIPRNSSEPTRKGFQDFHCGPPCGPYEKSALPALYQKAAKYLISFGSPGWIRTSDHSINSHVRPLSLARPAGESRPWHRKWHRTGRACEDSISMRVIRPGSG